MPDKVPTAAEVLDDPTASYWLKEALRKALQRDRIDALCDAEILTAILQARYNELLGATKTVGSS